MADNATSVNRNNLGAEVAGRAAFGTIAIDDEKQTIKTPLMSFSDSNVYCGLKLVSKYDEKTNTRQDPVPKITMSFNGTFVEVPLTGKWWKKWADFCGKMAEAMEGVDLANSNIKDDVDYAKDLMKKYRTKG